LQLVFPEHRSRLARKRVAAKTNPDERTLIQRMEAALTVLD
jgi:hypothetical protein